MITPTANAQSWEMFREIAHEHGLDQPNHFGAEPSTLTLFDAQRPQAVTTVIRGGRRRRPAKRTAESLPRAGEVRLQVFLTRERARTGLGDTGVYARVLAGYYPGLVVRRAPGHVVFVSGGRV